MIIRVERNGLFASFSSDGKCKILQTLLWKDTSMTMTISKESNDSHNMTAAVYTGDTWIFDYFWIGIFHLVVTG